MLIRNINHLKKRHRNGWFQNAIIGYGLPIPKNIIMKEKDDNIIKNLEYFRSKSMIGYEWNNIDFLTKYPIKEFVSRHILCDGIFGPFNDMNESVIFLSAPDIKTDSKSIIQIEQILHCGDIPNIINFNQELTKCIKKDELKYYYGYYIFGMLE